MELSLVSESLSRAGLQIARCSINVALAGPLCRPIDQYTVLGHQNRQAVLRRDRCYADLVRSETRGIERSTECIAWPRNSPVGRLAATAILSMTLARSLRKRTMRGVGT